MARDARSGGTSRFWRSGTSRFWRSGRAAFWPQPAFWSPPRFWPRFLGLSAEDAEGEVGADAADAADAAGEGGEGAAAEDATGESGDGATSTNAAGGGAEGATAEGVGVDSGLAAEDADGSAAGSAAPAGVTSAGATPAKNDFEWGMSSGAGSGCRTPDSARPLICTPPLSKGAALQGTSFLRCAITPEAHKERERPESIAKLVKDQSTHYLVKRV